MYADGDRIVRFKDMSLQMSGITGAEIEAFWDRRAKPTGRQDSSIKRSGGI